MTTQLTQPSDVRAPGGRLTLGQVLPGAAALLYAGIQVEGGVFAAAYRGITDVSDDRLNYPFSGGLATATSVSWGISQVLFVLTLIAFARSSALGSGRAGRLGAGAALVGGVAFVGAHAVSAVWRDTMADDTAGVTAIALFTVAGLLTAIGFTVAGVAVARAGVWNGWQRWTVLAVGVWMICLIPLQFTDLLAASVSVYAVTVAAFAMALLSRPEQP
jgi:hypothetical protein